MCLLAYWVFWTRAFCLFEQFGSGYFGVMGYLAQCVCWHTGYFGLGQWVILSILALANEGYWVIRHNLYFDTPGILTLGILSFGAFCPGYIGLLGFLAQCVYWHTGYYGLGQSVILSILALALLASWVIWHNLFLATLGNLASGVLAY